MSGSAGHKPAVVAAGGGHGLANTLRAARHIASAITAVVTVADDGGSSGRLRRELGTIPPGDLRKCLVALSETDGPWPEAFEHRFGAGELAGHPLGNLMIAGLIEATGDVVAALDEAGRLVGASGRVLPATVEPVVLRAEGPNGPVEGQVAVAHAGKIDRLSVMPPRPAVPEDAIKAIAAADLVVIGPGSLYTSVLAAVVIPEIREALESTTATKVYVCNLRPQASETAGYDVAAHVTALADHGIPVDVVLCDPAGMPLGEPAMPVAARPLAAANGLTHDPQRLAAALLDLVG